ncbi:toxin YoeB [Rhodococcus sp. 27YEA15]|uniref:Txe/YoeB family addiction module toxin n=1 Tax=Rhodococcus sp. 27YEA15 TaxID=3156259 RepID=UPI003C7D09C3
MKVAFDHNGWEDYTHWQSADRSILKRINKLIDAILRDPTSGEGKPELLKHSLAGAYSRRIDREHRLVYFIENDTVVIVQARYHY